MTFKSGETGELPGGLLVLGFHGCGPDSIPGPGTEMPQAAKWTKKKKKKKERKKAWINRYPDLSFIQV